MNRSILRRFRRRGALLGVAATLACLLGPSTVFGADATQPAARPAAAQPTQQASFDSAEAAAAAVGAAARALDGQQMLRILGAAAKGSLQLTDKVAMRTEWTSFAQAYERKHTIQTDGPDRAKLVVGEDDWVFPYPLVKKDGRWRFDTVAGNEEVVARRVGANELYTIEAALAIVDAQREYASRDWDGDGLLVYAARFVSTTGKKDGLYWKANDGEPESPLGPLAARAQAQGYGKSVGKGAAGKPAPFHGYHYRLLTEQGPDAPGGAYDYKVRDKLLGGFALVAYPAQYGVTGVMSFIVNYDGVVYEKDLGPDTARLARKMKAYNPDKSWKEAKRG